jgi:hypothetical protein
MVKWRMSKSTENWIVEFSVTIKTWGPKCAIGAVRQLQNAHYCYTEVDREGNYGEEGPHNILQL